VDSKTLVAAVFCASLLFLGYGAGRAGIATAYVDPVAKIQAQDEATYAASSLRMATYGDWMTPRFLGRYALYKPPVLYWLTAPAIKILGRRALALRAPSILASAATVTLVFAWLSTTMPLEAALAGACLLLSSHLFFVLSRVGIMDALLTFWTAAAMYALVRDPRLESGAALLGFGFASGAAIMTKALAGLYPLLILALFCLLSKERPRVVRLAQVVAVTAAVSLPWHLWQLYEHRRWFWTEYVLNEQVTLGLSPRFQMTQESQVQYYWKRLIATDPLLLAASLVALWSVRSRILIAWIVIALGCPLVFQHRNTSYLMPALPAMALLAASAIPRRSGRIVLTLAVALLIGKVFAGSETWGVPYRPESVNPSLRALDAYAARHRGNDLILIEPDDQFYAADLDMPQVRYAYLDPRTVRPKFPLDYDYLGISVTEPDFERMAELKPVFAQRLREWNLDSTEPIATVIVAQSKAEMEALIRSHPESDFYVPAEWVERDRGVHQIWQPIGPRVFLLGSVSK
jgi:hypothetical protein